SAGKSFSIAGLRCAVLHFGSEQLQQRFHEVFPPRMLGGINVVGADATMAAWRHGDAWFEQMLDVLRQNRARVEQFVDEEHAGRLSAVVPESTYLYWIDCCGLGLSDETPAELFTRGGVVLSAGREFGPDYDQFVRLNFATSPEILDQIL